MKITLLFLIKFYNVTQLIEFHSLANNGIKIRAIAVESTAITVFKFLGCNANQMTKSKIVNS